MDDIEFRDALRRYSESGGPPFSLTANALVSQGRRRARWRWGLSMGTASVVGLVMASVIVLPPGGAPVLDRLGCEWSLPAFVPPTVTPDAPGWPSHEPTMWPSDAPTHRPMGSVEPTGYPTQEPTSYPSELAAQEPTSHPSVYLTSAPGPLPDDVNQGRLDAMSCYLKREMLELFPEASFAPPSDGPMEVARDVIWWRTGWQTTYRAAAFVVIDDRAHIVDVSVRPQPLAWQPAGDYQRVTTSTGNAAYFDPANQEAVTLATGDSLVSVRADGLALTVEQLIALADAPELDLYR